MDLNFTHLDEQGLWGRHENESAEEFDLLRLLDPSDSGGGMQGGMDLLQSPPVPHASQKGRMNMDARVLTRSVGYAGSDVSGLSQSSVQRALPVPQELSAPAQPPSFSQHSSWGRPISHPNMPPGRALDELPHTTTPLPTTFSASPMWHPSFTQREVPEEEDDDEIEEGSGSSKKRKGPGAIPQQQDADEVTKERNREHARNTRLRKKAYVAKLSQLVVELKAEKEAEERLVVDQGMQDKERCAALHEFLMLRGSGEPDLQRWRRVLCDDVVLTLPITPYRSFRHTEIRYASRAVYGVDAVMADARSLKVCLEHIGSKSSVWKGCRARGVRIRTAFTIVGDVIKSPDAIMARWKLSTTNAVECGALCEVQLHGMLRCAFTPSPLGAASARHQPGGSFMGTGERISSCEFVFDVMTFMQQLLVASGPEPAKILGSLSGHDRQHEEQGDGSESTGRGGVTERDITVDEVPVVANTLDMACSPSREARAITEVRAPFKVVCLNAAWARRCGATEVESVGKPLSILQHLVELGQGQRREPRGLLSEDDGAHLLNDIRMGRAGSACVADKDGQTFMRVFPLTRGPSSPEITHLLVELIA